MTTGRLLQQPPLSAEGLVSGLRPDRAVTFNLLTLQRGTTGTRPSANKVIPGRHPGVSLLCLPKVRSCYLMPWCHLKLSTWAILRLLRRPVRSNLTNFLTFYTALHLKLGPCQAFIHGQAYPILAPLFT